MEQTTNPPELISTVVDDYYEDYYNKVKDMPQVCNNGSVKDFSQALLPSFYIIIFILGVIGNGLVVCVLLKYRRRFMMADMFFLNLAIADLLFLMSLPFWAHNAVISEWIFGGFMCKAVTTFYMLGIYGSIFFMVLMTVDCYAIIVHAQTSMFSKSRSVGVGAAVVVFLWCLSLGAALPNIIFTQVKNESDGMTCKDEYPEGTKWRHVTYIQLNVLSLLLPLAVMGFCYSRIIPILLTMRSQKKHNAVKLILMVVVVFFLFWTPYNIIIFMQLLQHSGYITSCEWKAHVSMAMIFVETIAFSHCCLNPIIYAFMGQNFRSLVVEILKKCLFICFRKCPSQTVSSEFSDPRSSVRSSTEDYNTLMM